MSALAAVAVVFFVFNIFGTSSLSDIIDENRSEVVIKVQSGESNDPLPSLKEDEDCEDCSMAIHYEDTMEDIDIPDDDDILAAYYDDTMEDIDNPDDDDIPPNGQEFKGSGVVHKVKDNLTSTEIDKMIRDQRRRWSITHNYGKNTSMQKSYNFKHQDNFGGRPNSQMEEYVTIWNSDCGPCGPRRPRRPGNRRPKIWKNVQVVSLKGCYNPWKNKNKGFQVQIKNERIYWSVGIDGKGKMPKSVPLKRIDENTGFSIVKWWKGSKGMFGIINEHHEMIGKGTRNQFPMLIIRLFLNSLFEKKKLHTYYIYWGGGWTKVSTKNWKLPGWDGPEKIKKNGDWQIITKNEQTIIIRPGGDGGGHWRPSSNEIEGSWESYDNFGVLPGGQVSASSDLVCTSNFDCGKGEKCAYSVCKKATEGGGSFSTGGRSSNWEGWTPSGVTGGQSSPGGGSQPGGGDSGGSDESGGYPNNEGQSHPEIGSQPGSDNGHFPEESGGQSHPGGESYPSPSDESDQNNGNGPGGGWSESEPTEEWFNPGGGHIPESGNNGNYPGASSSPDESDGNNDNDPGGGWSEPEPTEGWPGGGFPITEEMSPEEVSGSYPGGGSSIFGGTPNPLCDRAVCAMEGCCACDEHCGKDELCDLGFGFCEAKCSRSSDCKKKKGFIAKCNRQSGKCEYSVKGTDSADMRCNRDKDCGRKAHCVTGYCFRKCYKARDCVAMDGMTAECRDRTCQYMPPPEEPGECRRSKDCGPTLVCKKKSCVKACSSWRDCPSMEGTKRRCTNKGCAYRPDKCSNDKDCRVFGSGYKCKRNQCKNCQNGRCDDWHVTMHSYHLWLTVVKWVTKNRRGKAKDLLKIRGWSKIVQYFMEGNNKWWDILGLFIRGYQKSPKWIIRIVNKVLIRKFPWTGRFHNLNWNFQPNAPICGPQGCMGTIVVKPVIYNWIGIKDESSKESDESGGSSDSSGGSSDSRGGSSDSSGGSSDPSQEDPAWIPNSEPSSEPNSYSENDSPEYPGSDDDYIDGGSEGSFGCRKRPKDTKDSWTFIPPKVKMQGTWWKLYYKWIKRNNRWRKTIVFKSKRGKDWKFLWYTKVFLKKCKRGGSAEVFAKKNVFFKLSRNGKRLIRVKDGRNWQQSHGLNQFQSHGMNQLQSHGLNQLQSSGLNQLQSHGLNQHQNFGMNQHQNFGMNQHQNFGLNKRKTYGVKRVKKVKRKKIVKKKFYGAGSHGW